MRLILIAILLLATNAVAAVINRPEVFLWGAILSAVLALWVLAEGILAGRSPAPAAAPAAEPPEPTPAAPKARNEDIDAEVVHFLGLLQQKGRFVDFLMEDVTSFSNEQVGAAARVVHQGCSRVLKEFFTIAPAHEGEDGSQVTLDSGYDSARYQLTGKVDGAPPFKGSLAHHGWVAREVKLPRIVDTKRKPEKGLVIAPAEVEIK